MPTMRPEGDNLGADGALLVHVPPNVRSLESKQEQNDAKCVLLLLVRHLLLVAMHLFLIASKLMQNGCWS